MTPARHAAYVPRFTAQQSGFDALDDIAAACFWRNRRAGLSHAEAMVIAVDDMLMRDDAARRLARQCSRAS